MGVLRLVFSLFQICYLSGTFETYKFLAKMSEKDKDYVFTLLDAFLTKKKVQQLAG